VRELTSGMILGCFAYLLESSCILHSFYKNWGILIESPFLKSDY